MLIIVQYGEDAPASNGSVVRVDTNANAYGHTLFSDQAASVIDITPLLPPKGTPFTLDDVQVAKVSSGLRITVMWDKPGSVVYLLHGDRIRTRTGGRLVFLDYGIVDLIHNGVRWIQCA